MEPIICIDPATLEEIGRVEPCGEQKVKELVSKARASHPVWNRISMNERAAAILRARRYLLENIDDFAMTITRDNGKPLVESMSAEILPVADLLRWVATDGKKILSERPLDIGVFKMLLRSSSIRFQPLGVVAVISPWNYPFSIPVGAIAMALLAGNCVVFKPSSATALVGKKIEEMFSAAGLPEFVFTHVAGGAATGEALLNSRIDKVIFTGSVGIGRHVGEVCSRNLVPSVLELGGKDAAIIMRDADLDVASSAVVWGAFTNNGQCCASVERCYVDSSVFERFTKLVVEKTKRLRIGVGTNPSTDIGPMTTEAQLNVVAAQVEDARRRGAQILCGGRRPEKLWDGSVAAGWYYEPTVLVGVDHSFECVAEETFGPLLPVMPFEDEQQAVRLANDSQYGLNAYVFGGDLKSAKRVAHQLRAGTVAINECVYTHAIPSTPWGGVCHSGWGRAHGEFGFMEMVNVHHIHVNRLRMIKDFWWYPYSGKLYGILKRLSRTLTLGFAGLPRALPDLMRGFLRKKI